MDVPLWRRVICREIVDMSIDKQQLACLLVNREQATRRGSVDVSPALAGTSYQEI
jgi:hypothetical protein